MTTASTPRDVTASAIHRLKDWARTDDPGAANDPKHRVRRAIVWLWRLYAVVSLLLVVDSLDRLLGPTAEPAFGRHHAADFGGFYTGATIVWRDRASDLGDIDTQKQVQAEIQAREQTGWKWFNPLPHPPVLSLLTAPIAELPIRTAYWLWVLASVAAAGVAAYLLARVLSPAVPIATTIILLCFEPLWHLVWWGQVDAFILLPVAAGCALLLRARSGRDEVAAGLLIGTLALIPQYAVVPFLALAVARRRAAAGMAAMGGLLALASVAMVGRDGLAHYVDMVRYFGAFTGTATVTERAMFNVRGMVLRLGLDLGEQTIIRLVWAIALILAALTVAAAGRALRPGRAPDLALGLVLLAALLTSYHTHRQTLVFLFVLFAALVGRSLAPGTHPAVALLWATPVIGLHAATAILRREFPISAYPIQTYLAPVCLALLLLLALALLVPHLARHLDGWPRVTVARLPQQKSGDGSVPVGEPRPAVRAVTGS